MLRTFEMYYVLYIADIVHVPDLLYPDLVFDIVKLLPFFMLTALHRRQMFPQ